MEISPSIWWHKKLSRRLSSKSTFTLLISRISFIRSRPNAAIEEMILVLNITELRHKFRLGLEHWRQRKEQRQVRLLLQSVSESSGTFCDHAAFVWGRQGRSWSQKPRTWRTQKSKISSLLPTSPCRKPWRQLSQRRTLLFLYYLWQRRQQGSESWSQSWSKDRILLPR